jgi:hypothetical protein
MRAEQGLGGGRAEAHENLRRDHGELGVQPRPAGVDVDSVRALVDAPPAAKLVVEMLDHVGDEHLGTLDPSPLETLVQHAPGRPDEGVALDVLAVAGLLADQHQAGVTGALAEDRLRGPLPQLAGAAPLDRLAQRRQTETRRHWRRCESLRVALGHVPAVQVPQP